MLSALRALAVLCLQEVTPKVAVDIQSALPSWSSDPGNGSSVGREGVMILIPPHLQVRFSWHDLPTRMGRRLLAAELDGLTVGTVHLESENQDMREAQLAACQEVMQQWPDMVLAGDFNLFSEASAGCLQRLPEFVDLWPFLRQEPGNT